MHPLTYLLIVPVIPALSFLAWMKWFLDRRNKRSRRPFEDMPRPAGWSLQIRMEDQMTEFTLSFMAAMMAGIVAWAFSVSRPDTAALILSLGFIACGCLLWKSSRILLRYANIRLGLLGEQVVGQMLDRVSSNSIRVFHDLEVVEPGKSSWNIDHVVVTPAGVFAIETKCRRKPRGVAPDGQQGHKVIFDGQQLIFPTPMKADRFGIDQAQRNAKWLSDKLTSLNAVAIFVAPALVLPGWWIDAKGKGPVSVLSHKGLPRFLTGRTTVFSDQQFRAICFQLEERCRIDLSRPA